MSVLGSLLSNGAGHVVSGPRGETLIPTVAPTVNTLLSEIDRIDETKENICKNNRFLKKQNKTVQGDRLNEFPAGCD